MVVSLVMAVEMEKCHGCGGCSGECGGGGEKITLRRRRRRENSLAHR